MTILTIYHMAPRNTIWVTTFIPQPEKTIPVSQLRCRCIRISRPGLGVGGEGSELIVTTSLWLRKSGPTSLDVRKKKCSWMTGREKGERMWQNDKTTSAEMSICSKLVYFRQYITFVIVKQMYIDRKLRSSYGHPSANNYLHEHQLEKDLAALVCKCKMQVTNAVSPT